MNVARLIVIGVCCAAIARVSAQQSGPAEAALESARLTAVIDGDLPAAIAKYQAVVTQYVKTDRASAAQALIRIAQSYEKLEDSRSQAAYARVVQEFGDQTQLVARARARLWAIAPRSLAAANQNTGIRPRRVTTLERAWLNSLSADGSLAAGSTYPEPSSLFLLNLGSGQITGLGVQGNSPILSADGRQIAYLADSSLRVVNAAPGSQSRVLMAKVTSGFEPFAWSADGRSILARSGSSGRGQPFVASSLVSIDATDGTLRTVRSFESGPGIFIQPRLSPDGRFVAFVKQLAPGSEHIFVLDLQSGIERDVVRLAGRNANPTWSIDGRYLFFQNNPNDDATLWITPVANGDSAGSPVRLQTTLGDRSSLLGLTLAGTLLAYTTVSAEPHVLVVDRTSGSQVVEWFPGDHVSMSADGRVTAFMRARGGRSDLIVRSLESGEERSISQSDEIAAGAPRWLHDGSGLIVLMPGQANGTGGSFHFMDARNGALRFLFDRNAPGHIREPGGAALSRDDKSLYMVTKVADGVRSPASGIVAVDLATGIERPVATFPSTGLFHAGLALSPDGSTLAVMARQAVGGDARIYAVSVDGTGFREVHGPFPAAITWDVMQWTPDGQSILFPVLRRPEGGTGWHIMRVPATGGTAVVDGFDSTRVTGTGPLPTLAPGGAFRLDLGPDGSRMVLGARTQATHELWAFDNVLGAVSGQ